MATLLTCSMCGAELFRGKQAGSVATPLSCFHALCSTCAGRLDAASPLCPVCGERVEAGHATAESLVFRPPSELVLQMRAVVEAMEWQQGYAARVNVRPKAAEDRPDIAPTAPQKLADPNARLTMKKRGGTDETTTTAKSQASRETFNRPKVKIALQGREQ